MAAVCSLPPLDASSVLCIVRDCRDLPCASCRGALHLNMFTAKDACRLFAQLDISWLSETAKKKLFAVFWQSTLLAMPPCTAASQYASHDAHSNTTRLDHTLLGWKPMTLKLA